MNILWCDIKKNSFNVDWLEHIEKIINIKSRNYLYEEDRIRHLVGILLAEYGWNLLKRRAPVNIIYDSMKPHFIGLNDEHNVQFNISHSGDIVVCAIGHTKVGIDVEKKGHSYEEIIKHYFSCEEKNICDVNSDYFYKIWTRKESYLKTLGKGVSELSSVPSVVQDGEFVKKIDEYYFYEIDICLYYEVVLCSMDRKEDINVLEVDEVCLKEFLDMIRKN